MQELNRDESAGLGGLRDGFTWGTGSKPQCNSKGAAKSLSFRLYTHA